MNPDTPLPQRKWLHHRSPGDVHDAVFFITQCCQQRGANTLCREATAKQLLDSAQFHHNTGRWFVHLFLLMPDHLHALLSVPSDAGLGATWSAWKRYTARQAGIEWQRGFFDHRLRHDESFSEKVEYILQNPVRKKLAALPSEWPFVIGWDRRDKQRLDFKRMVGRGAPTDPLPLRTPGTGVPTTCETGRDGSPSRPNAPKERA